METVVDVHCHVFNADDLPVRGFIRRTQLSSGVLGAALSELVDRLIQGTAPGYAADLARLNAILGTAEGLEAAPVPEAASTGEFERDVDVVMSELQGSDPDLLLRLGTELAVQETPSGGEEGLQDVWESARRAVRWVKLFGRSRLDLAAELVRNFDDEIDLATPLLVDLGTGLGDVAKTTPRQQLELFEKLSRVSMLGRLPGGGKARLHPFIGFDPLRELRARRTGDIETPLELVQIAITRYGFTGVKVYPPMGWRPSGNRPRPGLSAADAAELDHIVDDLAAWCAAEDVPITAHCNDSNQADPAFAGFGRPDDWLPVLIRHPGLRVNLGHFGGAQEHEPPDGWPWKIAAAAREQTGLFADVGNHRVYDKNLTTAYFTMLEQMFAAPETAAMAHRLMFGSDWYMVAIHPAHDRFLERYRALFEQHFGAAATARFLGGNALSYLGFDDASNKNAQRLLTRYRRFAPDRVPSWLAR
jgi:predicted TIM-barrel fold metal-dependent hydrolase